MNLEKLMKTVRSRSAEFSERLPAKQRKQLSQWLRKARGLPLPVTLVRAVGRIADELGPVTEQKTPAPTPPAPVKQPAKTKLTKEVEPKPRQKPAGKTENDQPKKKQEKKQPVKKAQPKPQPQPTAKPEPNAKHQPAPPVEGKTRFEDLDLPAEILRATRELGFEYCTDIQADSMPKAIAGMDVFGKAQTGTGKTAAFLITIFNHLLKNPKKNLKSGQPRALVVAPTRELAIQIERDGRDLGKYINVNFLAVYGGMDYDKQRKRLHGRPVDVLVATPGRLLDYNRKRDVNLRGVEILVIDEADRMLDMGFIPDINSIVRATPPKDKRQTLLYGATLTSEIHNLGKRYTKDAHVIEVDPEQMTAEAVEQVIYIVTESDKLNLLVNMIHRQKLDRVIIFTNRKDETRWLTDRLREYGFQTEILSGDIHQTRRLKTLDNFKDGKLRLVVATDVAGRGIHIDGLSHVVNYHLPMNAEDYVHRIGRTGRAGEEGISVSFADENDGHQIPVIEKYIDQPLKCIHPPDEWLDPPPLERKKLPKREPQKRPGGRGNRRGSGGRGRRPSGSRRR